MQSSQVTPKRIPFMEHETNGILFSRQQEELESNASIDISNYEPLKLMVHNVSHADLCVTILPDSVVAVNRKRELMARPRASRYKVR